MVWDLKKGEALCGAPLLAIDVKCFSADALRFATCGSDSSLYIWQLDRATQKLARHEVQLGQYKRNFTRLLISEDDASILVGSTSGDVAQARPQHHVVGCRVLCRLLMTVFSDLYIPGHGKQTALTTTGKAGCAAEDAVDQRRGEK